MNITYYPKLFNILTDSLKAFLENNGLIFKPTDIEGIVVAGDEHGHILGCIGHDRNTLKYFCVDNSQRNTGVGLTLVSKLINVLLTTYSTLHAFTSPIRAPIFQSMGFKLLVTQSPYYALLEYGPKTINDYLTKINNSLTKSLSPNFTRAAIVVNANPFTLGHQYLINYASKQCDELVIFVVETNKSLFSFTERLEMVKKGCNHLKNVKVFGTSDYMVSSATFPHYFLKEIKVDEIIKNQCLLDAKLFSNSIATSLAISIRFVGNEPFSGVTNAYNQAMKTVFSETGYLKLIEIDRLEYKSRAISASDVRALLKEGNNDWQKLVPETSITIINQKS